MMRGAKVLVTVTALAAALAGEFANAQPVPSGPPFGRGFMMGRGMMMGPGMAAMHVHPANFNLTVNDVKAHFEAVLAARGNPRIKLGNVSEIDADRVRVEIVTTDKEGLVQRLEVDRHTGDVRPG